MANDCHGHRLRLCTGQDVNGHVLGDLKTCPWDCQLEELADGFRCEGERHRHEACQLSNRHGALLFDRFLLDLLLEIKGSRHRVLIARVSLDPRHLLADLEATWGYPVAALVHSVRQWVETGPLDPKLCKIGE